MGTFDSIDESVIKELDDKRAVMLLHDLIYAEAKRLSISTDMISVPYEIDTPDGGIDAVVKTGDFTTDGDTIIFEGKTYYQVKSGKATLTDSGMEDILCVDKKKDAVTRDLKPKIRQIAEDNGTLVLFLTGKTAPKIEDAVTAAETVIKRHVPKTALSVRIIQVDNILAMLDRYLSLRLKLLKIRGFTGRTFDEWSDLGNMSNYLEADERRTTMIEAIRSLVRSNEQNDKEVRITGYPGIGKTRSVLEALRTEDLSPLVIYFEKPSPVLETSFLTQLGARYENEAIIVVDECDPLSRTQLSAALAGTKSNVKLVTIYNEEYGVTNGVKVVNLNEDERLSTDSIIAIMKDYQVPDDVAKRWESFCDGSPRVAHMIAENLRNDSGDILADPSYDRAMERMLTNTDKIDSDAFKKRRIVVSWLALFHKFGWSNEFADERKFILHKIMQKTNYSEQDIEDEINELRKRKVLQGDKTLYISPRLLHIRACVWWWEQNGSSFDLNAMKQVVYDGETTAMSNELYDWYTQMFEYAGEVQGASDVVQKLLALDGPLANEPELIEALSGNFFRGLAVADPEKALLLIENWFSNKTDKQLETLQFDRMNLVRALEGIAAWKYLFVGAAELLLRLAATETNHTYSNNSEGTFAGLFSSAYGKLASSEAHPSDRLPVLERALKSNDPRKQLMAIRAVDCGLEATHYTKIIGDEMRGLKEDPDFWMPATYGEHWDAIRDMWNLLLKYLPSLDTENKLEAAKVLNSNMRGLISHTGHGTLYLEDYARLVKDGVTSHSDAVDFVNIALRFDSKRIKKDTLQGIKKLAEYLEGDDFTSRLKRYIAHNSPDDWWGEDEDVKRSEAKVAKLVQEVIDTPSLLKENDWLFTDEAQNGYRFGRGIGDIDVLNSFVDELLRLQQVSDEKYADRATFVFVSGYLMSLYQRDKGEWQKILDRIYGNKDLIRWYADACWRSHLDDYNADRILECLKNGSIDSAQINMFRYGAMVKDLSSTVFHRWIEYLLSIETLESVAIAIDLYAAYYVHQEKKELPLPVDLTQRLITSSALRKKDDNVARRIDYDWSMIAERFIAQNPDQISDLFEFLLSNFDKEKTIFGSYGDYVKGVMNKIVKIDPSKAWRQVAKYLEKDDRSWRLEMSWLGGGASFGDDHAGAMSLFLKDDVLAWADEKPKEKRINKIAYMMPHDYDHEEGADSWYATILDRYGNDRSVSNSVAANFGTEGFSGPSSLHYAKKVEKVKRFGEMHKDSPNIQAWVSRIVSQLNAQVQEARLREERRDY